MADPVRITAAFISDLPRRREYLRQKLEKFGIFFVAQGDVLDIDILAGEKPAILLLEPDGVVESIAQLRTFVHNLGRVSPGTRIVVSADGAYKTSLGVFCQQNGIRVVSPSADHIQLAQEMMAPRMEEGQTPLEIRIARLGRPEHDYRGLNRGRR
jgi:hypothetical protein